MKKILSIVFALALVFALAACGADKTPATTDNAAASDNPAEPVKLRARRESLRAEKMRWRFQVFQENLLTAR